MRYLLIFALIFASCSGEPKKIKNKEHSEIEPKEDQSKRIPVTFLRPSVELPNSALADFLRVSKKHKIIPFFCRTQDGNLFITSNKKFELNDLRDPKNRTGIKFGLIDSKGIELLPLEYDKIGNPGIYADGYLEVQKDKKHQLYDYIHKRIITEKFDIIFPSMIMGYLAIGKRNGEFYKVYEDGTIRKIVDEKYYPTYKRITERLEFDVQSEDFGLWINTELFTAEYKDEMDAGLYVLPSFIDNLQIHPSFITGVTIKGTLFGTSEYKVTSSAFRKRNENTSSLLMSFMEEGIDGRGWSNEQQHLLTLDKKNNVKAKKKVNSLYDSQTQNICKDCEATGYKFINDSLLEVKYWVFNDSEFAKPGMDSLFTAMTQFSYFHITSDGKIKPMYEGSLFPMASVLRLNHENLKGCFLKDKRHRKDIETFDILEDFKDYEMDMESGWVAEFTHLTAQDIRFMINEIYARHGYIFADKKLNNYFRSQKWYKPKSRNVEGKLSDLEKQNIYFLESVEKRLIQNEKEELQPKRKFLVWAG